MPVKIYKRKGSEIYSYRGRAAGHRLRGSTGTTDKVRAQRIAAKKEAEQWDSHLDGPEAVLTFPQAVDLYLKAGKPEKYLAKLEDYWKDAKVKDMTRGGIKQSAIEIYPGATGATWNRQVITPTQAIINHSASLEKCSPIKIERFEFEQQIKQPVSLQWLDTLCAHARPVIAALGTLMFATGCRISDARRLDWPEIDFQRRMVAFRKTKAKKQRFANMPPRLLVALANLPRDRKPFGYASESALRRWWDDDIKITAEAVPDFDRLTFHCCRHGATTALLHDGQDVVTVGKLVGMSAQQVLRTYGHAKDDPTLTNRLFDTELTQAPRAKSKIKDLKE
jgi:integrase